MSRKQYKPPPFRLLSDAEITRLAMTGERSEYAGHKNKQLPLKCDVCGRVGRRYAACKHCHKGRIC